MSSKNSFHFLHIRKTGGTALVHALNQNGYCAKSPHRAVLNIPDPYDLNPHSENHQLIIYVHPHDESLKFVPEGEKVFFFLRDPISRFISGFYSRQRQGRPRYNSPWNAEEKIIYENFKTCNQLASALTSRNAEEKKLAEKAMRMLRHVRDSYWTWFENEEYLRSRQNDIFFIGFQENLTEDFETLKSKLNLSKDIKLPEDDINAHKNPDFVDKKLSDVAITNLRNWYQADYKFIKLCQDIFPYTILSNQYNKTLNE